MKREIKFRGLCKFTNKWAYGDLIHVDNKPYRIFIYGKESFFIKPETATQFTGLKDKNGKEIWEGDILKVHIFTQELGESLGVREGEKEFVAEIWYQELGLWLQGNNEEDGGYMLWFNGMHEESIEVIGNIFENPALLNTGGQAGN